MRPTETITLINHYNEKHEDKYQLTTIKGVYWHGSVAASLSDSGFKAANSFTVRIPKKSVSATYIPASEWSADNHDGWTLQEGDYIVKGEVSDITSPSDLRDSGQQMIAIKGYTENPISFSGLAHWKVVGA